MANNARASSRLGSQTTPSPHQMDVSYKYSELRSCSHFLNMSESMLSNTILVQHGRASTVASTLTALQLFFTPPCLDSVHQPPIIPQMIYPIEKRSKEQTKIVETAAV